MSVEENFGPLLEALVACVGVVDVVSLFAYTFNRKNAKASSMDINNNDVTPLQRVRDKSPKTDAARSIPQVIVDGVAPLTRSDDVIDSLVAKVNELESKMTELEVRSRETSMDRLVDMERYQRSRSSSPYPMPSGGISYEEETRYRRSKSPSPFTSGAVSRDDESSSYDGETNTSSCESRGSSVRNPSKLITRDDEFRKAKRSSTKSQGSREEELMELTKMEEQENENMDDFVPIHYEGQDDPGHRFHHDISPIQEIPSCPYHGEIEKSPEPGMSEIIDRPWGDVKKDAAEIRKNEKKDQMRRSLSIDEKPAEEEQAGQVEPPKVSAVDVNEMFIKSERNLVHQSTPKLLVKQGHVASEEHPEEMTADLELIPLPVVEIFSAPITVNSSMHEINLKATQDEVKNDDAGEAKGSSLSLDVEKARRAAAENDYAVRSTTSEPDVSMHKITVIDTEKSDHDNDAEFSNISTSPSSGEGLKRTKRCIDSLDRSGSRPSSRLSRGRISKSPSVTSQEDYKEWFDKFDNHITPNLTVPEDDYDDFESDVEEDFLLRSEDGNLNGAEICNIEDDTDTRDVSVSVTVSLRKSKSPVECTPCAEFQDRKAYKTKAEEFLELERFRENQQRRVSIVPSTEEQQKSYVSILHPEEFPPKTETIKKEPHQHHQHLHNVGYHEWMKKFVDHNSSHLATSDSDSDSDVSLDEVRMLPLFCDKKHVKSQRK